MDREWIAKHHFNGFSKRDPMAHFKVSFIIPATVLLLLAAGSVQADPGQNGKGPGMREEALKRFDKNGDGKLDEQERAAARQAIQARGLAGKVGPGIGGPGKNNGPGNGPGREAILKRFDKNGDGKLDEQERAAAMKARGEKGDGPGPGAGPGREEVLKRFDKDGDGKLNDEERAAARKAMEERKKNK
jgi:hypothetical protein